MSTPAQFDPVKISADCASVSDLARRSIDWLGHSVNKARAGQEFEPLTRKLRLNLRRAERLKSAASNPPSMAVYGASQAGKSYLVAHLAAPPSGSGAAGQAEKSAIVLPHNKNGGISFLDINPVGGRESTGLVTRFTKRPMSADPEYPVMLRLLTAVDLVKIMTSCFAEDLDTEITDEKPVDPGAVMQLLDDIRRLPRSGSNGLTDDDIYEIQELCRRRYGRVFQALLGSDYFETAASLVSGLDTDGLTRLCEPLWNSVPRLSLLFRKLHGALSQLGFATTVYCGIDSLLPRADEASRALTIIDVDTLKRVLMPTDEKVAVKHGGSTTKLDRPVVAALAAELVLNLGGQTRPFLNDIDLLDFPGARSRGGITLKKLEEAAGTEDVFLRGKVALLFDRYREEYDITSMLLCIGPGPQEVVPLRTLVHGWVEDTHGASADKRRKFGSTSLMVVLSKFDLAFERKAGEEIASSDRWKARIDSAITNFLAKSGKWTSEWTPGRPFSNVFWYRNPFIEQPHLFDLEKTTSGVREMGLRQAITSDVAEMRQAFLELDLVQQHFNDPAAAWNAAMTLNDGGITYLAEHIAQIGRTNIKLHMIQTTIAAIATETDREMRKFYFDTDPTVQRAARQQDAEKIAQELAAAGSELKFGRLLGRLVVSQDELETLFRSVRRRQGVEPKPAQPGQSTPPPPPASNPLWALIRGGGGTAAAPAAATASPKVTTPAPGKAPLDCSDPTGAGLDLAGRFACRSYSFWCQRVYDVCRSPDLLALYKLSPDGAQTLATELIAGSRRMRMPDQIADGTRPATGFTASGQDSGAATPALIAAKVINEYVAYIGRRGPVQDTDVKPDPKDPRFQRETTRDLPKLAEVRTVSAFTFCVDWVKSFLDMVGANAASASGVNFDIAQNEALGALLTKLKGLDLEMESTP